MEDPRPLTQLLTEAGQWYDTWALAHCMKKKRFTFGTVIGIDNLCGDPQFTVGFQEYLERKEVDPRMVEFVTIASCTGYSFVITSEIPEGESEDIEILTETSCSKYGSICHGTDLYHDQSILRNGLMSTSASEPDFQRGT